jgi:hypothetical protein
MIRKAVAILCLCVCAGCYTQFAMIDRNDAGIAPSDTSAAGDSAQSRIQDTVRVSNNQVCYWTRDMWGRPELRCDDSYYGRDWYRYNNYPWWSRSDPYYYGSYNSYGWDEQCPAFYYYDYSCGACRYYRDYQGSARSWWWDSPSAGSSGGSQPVHPRRSLSSPASGGRAGASGTSLKKGIANQGNGGSVTSSKPNRRTVNSVVSPSERAGSSSVSPVVKELPKQQVQDQQPPQEQRREQEVAPRTAPEQQQASPPPQQNQGTDQGQSNQPDQNQKSDNPNNRSSPRSF